MDTWLENVKNNKVFRENANQKLVKFRAESVAARAQAGEILLGQNDLKDHAMQMIADALYDKTEENDELKIENGGLKDQLGNLFNEDKLSYYCKSEKAKLGGDAERNKRILQDLNKRLEQSEKAITYQTSTCKSLPAPAKKC